MKIRLVVALVGFAIGFAVPTFAQEQNTVDPEVRQQIEAVNMKLLEARNKGDAAAAAAFYEQNAVQVWQWRESGRPAVGQKAIEEKWRLEIISTRAAGVSECTSELVQMGQRLPNARTRREERVRKEGHV